MDRTRTHTQPLYNSTGSSLNSYNPIQVTSRDTSLTRSGGSLSMTWEPSKCSVWSMLRPLTVRLLWGALFKGMSILRLSYEEVIPSLGYAFFSWESLGAMFSCGVGSLLSALPGFWWSNSGVRFVPSHQAWVFGFSVLKYKMLPEKPSLEALSGSVKAGFTEKRMSEKNCQEESIN